jgi:hypothetical protein
MCHLVLPHSHTQRSQYKLGLARWLTLLVSVLQGERRRIQVMHEDRQICQLEKIKAEILS